jgi:glycosyltransferase involved in cell wall biosynthesis
MILFLQHSAGGMRGGELYHYHLHSFLTRKFDCVEPPRLQPRPAEFRSIMRHSLASLKLVKAVKPSLLITDVSSGARYIMAAKSVKLAGNKLVIIIQERRTSYRFKNVFSKWLVHKFEDYMISLADILVVNSRYIAEYAKKRSKKEASIVVCYPGLELTSGKHSANDPPTNQIDDHLNLLAVGECAEPRKGIRYLLEALPQLADLNPVLHLAGGYSEKDPLFIALKEIIDRNELENRVIFHGFLDRPSLSALYQMSEIFVMPSLSEGYGMAMAEALSFGLPVVASNVGAIPEMVEDGVNALLVKSKDSQMLASAIRRLAGDQELRDRMRQENLARAATLPTWSDFDSTLERELVPLIEDLTNLYALSNSK